jgi:hypothetical protein
MRSSDMLPLDYNPPLDSFPYFAIIPLEIGT